MSYSRALKWFLILLLPLTLGWKLAVFTDDSIELNNKNAQLKIVEFLTRQHFAVVLSGQILEGLPIIRATAGACRMLVVHSPPDGSALESMRGHVTTEDRFYIVFGGNVYAELPTWLTATDALWAKFKRQLGLKAQATPMLMVVATTICEAERLPWAEFISSWHPGQNL